MATDAQYNYIDGLLDKKLPYATGKGIADMLVRLVGSHDIMSFTHAQCNTVITYLKYLPDEDRTDSKAYYADESRSWMDQDGDLWDDFELREHG